MHRICDQIKPGYLKAHIMYILHTYIPGRGCCHISSVRCMYVPTYIPGTRCCIQISLHWNISFSFASRRLASHSLRAPIACASTSVVATLLPYSPRFPAFSSLSPTLLSFSQKTLSFFVHLFVEKRCCCCSSSSSSSYLALRVSVASCCCSGDLDESAAIIMLGRVFGRPKAEPSALSSLDKLNEVSLSLSLSLSLPLFIISS
jgi:hypothetical protein